MTLLAHISDLHLNGTPRAADRVARVMDHLRALPSPPDALLVTGDIADHGDAAEYREAARLLGAPFPVLACPGNHDSRAALRTALLGDSSGSEPVNHAHRVGELTVLMCDSTVPGQEGGRLDGATLAWIDEALADAASPAVLAFHHPPVPVHHPMPDSVPLANAGDLAELLGRHPEVIAVLGGHAHTAAASAFAGSSRPAGSRRDLDAGDASREGAPRRPRGGARVRAAHRRGRPHHHALPHGRASASTTTSAAAAGR